MSVSHSWFARCAVKSRCTSSSWTGGPALRFRPRLFEKYVWILCCEHSRHIRRSDAGMPDSGSISSAINRYPNLGSTPRIARAALIRWASSQSRDDTRFLRETKYACLENSNTRQVTATGIRSAAGSRNSRKIILRATPAQIRGRPAQDLVLLLQQPDSLLRLPQLGRVALSDVWPDTVFNVGHRQPSLQARFGHAEIFRYPTDWGFAPSGNRNNIATELFRKCFRHDDHPSARTEILTALESTKPTADPWC